MKGRFEGRRHGFDCWGCGSEAERFLDPHRSVLPKCQSSGRAWETPENLMPLVTCMLAYNMPITSKLHHSFQQTQNYFAESVFK